MSEETYTRAELRMLTAARLIDGVAALEGRVIPSRLHPQQALAGQFPSALVYADTMRMTDQAPTGGSPEFRAVVTMTVILRAEGVTEEGVDQQLDALSDAVIAAFLEDPEYVAISEGIPEMTCARERRGNSDSVLGQETISFDMRFTDRREPAGLPPLREARMILDAIDPADKLGNYTGLPDFDPPKPPPRPTGPDGRAEGEIRIIYPQP